MTGPEVLDVARDAIITLVLVSAPLVAQLDRLTGELGIKPLNQRTSS